MVKENTKIPETNSSPNAPDARLVPGMFREYKKF
jgi:hypothetical protein